MSRIEAPRDHDTGPLLDRLLAGLPAEAVLTDPDVTVSYANDMASFCPSGTPAVVVLPRTVEQVQHVMRVRHRELRVPVVPQGARTGLSGAANASEGCIVRSPCVKMDRILEISPVGRIAVVEPRRHRHDPLPRGQHEHGLCYRPTPPAGRCARSAATSAPPRAGCAA
ncbi:FAD-binding oxidoreductase [Streptomyces sp. L7]